MAIFVSLEHVEIEQSAIFRVELVRLGREVRSVRLYKNERLPDLGAFDGLLVMGSPINIDEVDQHRFLAKKTSFLTRMIRQDIPTMGIYSPAPNVGIFHLFSVFHPWLKDSWMNPY